jgi:hypothetical protein
VVARLEVEPGRVPDLAEDDRVLLGRPVGRGGIGEVRQAAGDRVPRRLHLRQLGLELLDPA